MNIIQQLQNTFNQKFPTQLQQKYFFSPGRINLIGEHIDYNGGYVFPCSIDLGTYAITSARADNKFAVYSMNFPDTEIVEFNFNLITYDKNMQWVNYPSGVIKTIIDHGYKIPNGLNICYYGNLPNGAGLSSSASIEVLTATILNSYFALGINDINLIKYTQEAENKFVGVPCGIMDQFVIAKGRKNQAMLINCDTLNYQYAPIDLGGYTIVIANSNKKRTLA
ncbi:MAG: galactokinase, partial [Burkholderiales bacterium]|nr:galactokinase [Burkholderiales bacterium]